MAKQKTKQKENSHIPNQDEQKRQEERKGPYVPKPLNKFEEEDVKKIKYQLNHYYFMHDYNTEKEKRIYSSDSWFNRLRRSIFNNEFFKNRREKEQYKYEKREEKDLSKFLKRMRTNNVMNNARFNELVRKGDIDIFDNPAFVRAAINAGYKINDWTFQEYLSKKEFVDINILKEVFKSKEKDKNPGNQDEKKYNILEGYLYNPKTKEARQLVDLDVVELLAKKVTEQGKNMDDIIKSYIYKTKEIDDISLKIMMKYSSLDEKNIAPAVLAKALMQEDVTPESFKALKEDWGDIPKNRLNKPNLIGVYISTPREGQRDAEILKELKDLGYDPNALSKDGTPAFLTGKTKLELHDVQLLKDIGADFKLQAANGDTIAHKALLHKNIDTPQEIIEVLEFLKNNGVDINAENKNGRTAFEEYVFEIANGRISTMAGERSLTMELVMDAKRLGARMNDEMIMCAMQNEDLYFNDDKYPSKSAQEFESQYFQNQDLVQIEQAAYFFMERRGIDPNQVVNDIIQNHGNDKSVDMQEVAVLYLQNAERSNTMQPKTLHNLESQNVDIRSMMSREENNSPCLNDINGQERIGIEGDSEPVLE